MASRPWRWQVSLFVETMRFVVGLSVGWKVNMFVSLLQLGPWLAVEIPDLISKGAVKHKDAAAEGATNS